MMTKCTEGSELDPFALAALWKAGETQGAAAGALLSRVLWLCPACAGDTQRALRQQLTLAHPRAGKDVFLIYSYDLLKA